ncbi:MAG: quinoprotein relay system zinc metallohydrolase 2 [Paracoccus sp. (in: a-proteobacteria)]|nr:quinoprotein relay system zinc metallohydrolase 2 [Paracoccus sp. (in: a-proteobacteria)]
MYHLVLTACLAADPSICADRLIGGTASDGPDCGVAYRQTWAAAHPELVVSGARCVAQADLPALTLTQIAPDIWISRGADAAPDRRNRGRIANLGVVIGETVTVIDPGGSRAEGEALYAAIANLTDKPVNHVILTHMHPDHSLGAAVFAEADAALIAGEGYSAAISAAATTYLGSYAEMTGAAEQIGSRIIAPDGEIASRDQIGPLQLIKAPLAHTSNDLMVLDTASGTLFTGDLIFRDLTPSIDGSLHGWLAFLDDLTATEATLIVPGHGAPMEDASAMIGPLRDYLSALETHTRAAIAQGLSITQAVPVVMAQMAPLRGVWRGFDETTERNILTAYQELEWD